MSVIKDCLLQVLYKSLSLYTIVVLSFCSKVDY